MVFYILSYIYPRFLGFVYYLCEILPKFISQQRTQIPCTPTFYIIENA